MRWEQTFEAELQDRSSAPAHLQYTFSKGGGDVVELIEASARAASISREGRSKALFLSRTASTTSATSPTVLARDPKELRGKKI